jgi:anaerobic ribonucleoside-triphosphate reductase activating protein
MLKYTTTMVTFSEVPDEVALCINLSNCPYHCPACHSKELWGDIGEPLRVGKLIDLIEANKGITCVCFMGGDSDLEELYTIFKFMPMLYKDLKVAWYTGREDIPADLPAIDYIKIGPYIEEKGPINKRTTNQRLIMFNHPRGEVCADWYTMDITDKFWKNDSNS